MNSWKQESPMPSGSVASDAFSARPSGSPSSAPSSSPTPICVPRSTVRPKSAPRARSVVPPSERLAKRRAEQPPTSASRARPPPPAGRGAHRALLLDHLRAHGGGPVPEPGPARPQGGRLAARRPRGVACRAPAGPPRPAHPSRAPGKRGSLISKNETAWVGGPRRRASFDTSERADVDRRSCRRPSAARQ